VCYTSKGLRGDGRGEKVLAFWKHLCYTKSMGRISQINVGEKI